MDIKDAMQQATVKLRDNLGQGNNILAPNSSQAIEIDPIMTAYLGIDSPDAQMAEQVKDIQEFLKTHGYTTQEKTLRALRGIETKLGAQPGTRLEKLYRYVRLKNQALNLTRQANAMKR